MSSEKIIVLYERLSREDENLGESYSISNQKKLLEDYCREKGWTRFRHFTDDGISGTTFDRPSFKAMIQLVEDGEVETKGYEPVRAGLSCGRAAPGVLSQQGSSSDCN